MCPHDHTLKQRFFNKNRILTLENYKIRYGKRQLQKLQLCRPKTNYESKAKHSLGQEPSYVWDAQRHKGRCFLINIKAEFTTSWSNSKTKHKVPHSGHSYTRVHPPNMKNISHITSLTKSGTCSPDLVGGKRWGPWKMDMDWSSICSLSKEESGSTFSHSRVGIISVTCKTEQQGLDLEAMAASWNHSERNIKLYQTRPPANKWLGWLWMRSDGASFP